MKNITICLLGVITMLNANGQTMTQERLHGILEGISHDVTAEGNRAQITIDNRVLLCISDTSADRMRMITVVRSIEGMTTEMLLQALTANFHTTLDARYAISGDTLYAAFIHPLSTLNSEQVKSAVRQVAAAADNFGTTFSSDALYYPGQ